MYARYIKRPLDFILALVGVIVLSPLFLIVATLIKITSNGPVFFKQERLGRNGKVFKIIKFRSMIMNAENIGDGLRVKEGADPRITKLGAFLRRTSLDELPQLLNVIGGTMSLVGPRPPVTYHPYKGYKNYPDWASRRFEVRPGITGLAQVTVRNSASWDERIKIDIRYIEKFSFLFDIKILFSTLLKVVKREDVYGKASFEQVEIKEPVAK